MSNIYLPIWIETLILLREGHNTHQISTKLNKTYSHIHHIKNEFINKRWLVSKGKQGRENVYEWTTEGRLMYMACKLFLDEYKGENTYP